MFSLLDYSTLWVAVVDVRVECRKGSIHISTPTNAALHSKSRVTAMQQTKMAKTKGNGGGLEVTHGTLVTTTYTCRHFQHKFLATHN